MLCAATLALVLRRGDVTACREERFGTALLPDTAFLLEAPFLLDTAFLAVVAAGSPPENTNVTMRTAKTVLSTSNL